MFMYGTYSFRPVHQKLATNHVKGLQQKTVASYRPTNKQKKDFSKLVFYQN